MLFFLNSEEDVGKKQPKASSRKDSIAGSPVKNKLAGNKVLRNKTRSAAQEEAAISAAVRLAGHQKELHESRQRAGLAKYSEEGKGGTGKEGKTWKRFLSYKGESTLPSEVQSLRVSAYRNRHCPSSLTNTPKIFVDKKNHTIVLPINGFAVPFHINSVKNAVKSDEGEYTLLRINLQTPGQSGGKREDTVSNQLQVRNMIKE